MLTRIIIMGIAIALVIMLYRKLQRAMRANTAAPETPPVMKKCAQCGIHLPQSDAIQVGDHYYCSEEHRLQHQRNSHHHE